jgi:hypothetical protein
MTEINIQTKASLLNNLNFSRRIVLKIDPELHKLVA